MDRLTPLLLTALCLLTWAAAAWLRLRGLDGAVVGSDSLGPYLQALALTPAHLAAGFAPRPPNPESGDWLWITALPAVHLAGSLRELFMLRFAVGAAVAPLGLLAAWVWAAPGHVAGLWRAGTARQWAAATAAGAALAVDPGLADTLVSGARTYGAPELVALATLGLGLAWRGSRLGLAVAAVALVAGMDHHPFAAGMVVGGLLLLPGLAERHGLAEVGAAALLALLAASPRLLRLWAILRCGQDPLSCLAEVAQSNVQEEVLLLELLTRAAHDRFLVDLEPWVSAGLLVGLVAALVGGRPWPATWALGGAAGIITLAFVTGYLQSYHLRVLAAPLAVAAAVGLGRVWLVALAWGGWAVLALHARVPQGPDPGAVERHDALALRLADEEGPLWVDRAWWGGQPVLDASGVVLSAVLGGQAPARFTVGPEVPMVLLGVGDGPEPGPRRLLAGEVPAASTRWMVARFEDAATARAWLDRGPPPHEVGGAWDWLVALHPDRASLEAARW